MLIFSFNPSMDKSYNDLRKRNFLPLNCIALTILHVMMDFAWQKWAVFNQLRTPDIKLKREATFHPAQFATLHSVTTLAFPNSISSLPCGRVCPEI
jgi:hypothetical protein